MPIQLELLILVYISLKDDSRVGAFFKDRFKIDVLVCAGVKASDDQVILVHHHVAK